jgi:acyl-CoA synthetase (AMP-forming)/AMP-acid ligase II
MYPGIHAKSNPDKPAYIMAASGETVTYGQLDARSNQGAQLFRSLGLAPGDGIAILMENNARFFEVCWAAQRSGLVYTTISSRLTAPEAAYIARDSDAKAFVTSHAKRDVAAEMNDALAGLCGRYMVGGSAAGYTSWEEATAAQPAAPVADEVEGGDMLYSSGTTGRPKGVRVQLDYQPVGTPPALLALLTAMYGADEKSVYLSPAPLYHAAPLRFNMAMLRLGATCVVMEQFDAVEALRLIERHRVTHSQWVPSMFVRMFKLSEEERSRHDVSSLRAAIHAAAPCPIPVKEKMIDWWGPVLFEYYAGTEANGFTSINSEEWLTHKGSVGRPLVTPVHILDDAGNDLPPGEAGGVYFANETPFEYHNDPEKTAESKSAQGYTTLGDIGYVDEEGYVYLTDRKADMIISGGVNVYPREAEDVLVTHPAVADVAVFGVPNEDFGEEVKAVVQPIDPKDAGPELATELIEFCHGRLSKIKCPRSVDFEAELPRHPTGKLYKRLLKDRYWGGRASRIV